MSGGSIHSTTRRVEAMTAANLSRQRLFSPLENLTEIYQINNEIDHIVSVVGHAWTQRNGGKGTRDKTLQPKMMKVIVGPDMTAREHYSTGPLHSGGSATPPKSPQKASAMRVSKATGVTICQATRDIRKLTKVEEFPVRDFILFESPKLAEIYSRTKHDTAIGPIMRSAQLFPAVLMLLKLRWLVRLHRAFVGLAGNCCSLHRVLAGSLAEISEVHPHAHSPLQMYEQIVEALYTRLQLAWPLFLAYVSMHEDPQAGGPLESLSRLTPQPSELDVDGAQALALLQQSVDNVFITWLAQQDANIFPAGEVMSELDFFGLQRPHFMTRLDSLSNWVGAKYVPGSQPLHRRGAQRQAHHLALLLELPETRADWHASAEEMVDMARDVVAHPKTFNVHVCARISWILEGHCPLVPPGDIPEEQLERFHSHRAGAHDSGRLKPLTLQKMRDSTAPWLVGQEARFPGAVRPWPRENTAPAELLKSFQEMVSSLDENSFGGIGDGADSPRKVWKP